ncbi:MAG: purine-nucleoside phosphorylase [Oscillospiraceae bacterium]
MQPLTYQDYKASADWLLARAGLSPRIALILGSSLGPIADALENRVVIDYADIPNFLLSTVRSHAGQMIFGTLAGNPIVCMSGRFHSYEGYSFEQLSIPVRVLRLLGVDTLLLTNAAGAVNTAYRVGDIMVIADQIKLNGPSPLRGQNLPEFGERFFDVCEMYTPALRHLAADCAARLGQSDRMREGVYFFMPGPQFETPAEIRAIRILGGDAVGMSTVTEAITAAHCGMQLLGLSLMTNMAAGVLPQKLSGDEVTEAANAAATRFSALLCEIVKELGA